jgi:SAM-dependent methyltransferase
VLNPRLRAAAESLLPAFLLRALDPFETRVAEVVLAFSESLPEESRVLDAGAGELRFSSCFMQHRYVALDLAVGDVAWDYSHLDLLGDLEKLPLAAGSFDAALNIVTLEHVRRPHVVVEELARVLRPGGRLLIVVPHEWEVHQAPHDFFRFTRYGLEHLLTAAGLAVRHLEPVGGFYWLMARRSINFLTFFQGGFKWLLFVFLAPFFGLLLPVVFYLIDGLDRERNFTLGYICEAIKEKGVRC